MKKSAVIVLPFVLIVSVLMFFQNCSVTSEEELQNTSLGVKVNCIPADRPCLRYVLSVANLSRTRGAMSVLLQGSVNEGVLNNTSFSPNCNKINNSTAECPFNVNVTAGIESNSTTTTVMGDGRRLSINLFTSSEIESQRTGPLAKAGDQEPEAFCYTSENDVYDDHFVKFKDFSSCDSN